MARSHVVSPAARLAADGARLNPSSFVPLYVQLTEILQERIEQGRWQPGTRFLSERELCEQFQVSRTVVRPALTILENNGLLVRIKGRGTFVAPQKAQDRIAGLVRCLAGPIPAELRISILDVTEEAPDEELGSIMGLATAGERLLHVTSAGSVGARTVVFRDSFVSLTRVPAIAGAVGPRRVIGPAVPAQLGLRLAAFDVTVETSFCTPFEAELFGISAGAPTLLLRGLEHVVGDDGTAIGVEFVRMVYRADVVALDARLS
jgi:DNA-binding GntR family transcriptional regulator